MTGREALGALLALYDVAGQIRAQLIELQRETALILAPPHSDDTAKQHERRNDDHR